MPTRSQLVAAIDTLRGRTPTTPIKETELADMLQTWVDYFDNNGEIMPETFQAQLTDILSTYDQHIATFQGNIQAAATQKDLSEAAAIESKKQFDNMVAIKNELSALATTARIFQDGWNMVSNTPNLGGLALNAADAGKFWKVSVTAVNGTSTGITGTAVLAKVGDEFTWTGTKWVWVPYSDQAYKKALALEAKLPVKNLADPATYVDGSFISGNTGALSVDSQYFYTGFIQVTPLLPYSGKGIVVGEGMRHVAYYDENQVFKAGGLTANTITFTPPAGVYWVKVSVKAGDKATFQFEQAAAPTTFVPNLSSILKNILVYGSDITQSSSYRFVTDAEKAIFNGKLDASAIIVDTIVGKNIFKKTNIVNNSAISSTDGSINNVAGFMRSGPITVKPLTTYIISNLSWATQGRPIRFENASGVFVSYTTMAVTSSGSVYSGTFTTPADVTRMILNIQRSTEVANLDILQIEEGTAFTAYAEYSEYTTLKSVLGAIITKASLALGSVDNTSDANKPISLAQAAVNLLKLDKSSIVTQIVGASKNLANPAFFTDGYYVENTGAITLNSLYGYTDFIEVAPGSTYSGGSAAVPSMRKTTYYNAAKAVISGGSFNSISSFTAPAATGNVATDIKYVRVTYTVSSKSTFQFELATAPTSYVPYNAGTRMIVSIDGSLIASTGSTVVQDTLTLSNAEKILITGCSYNASIYSLLGKSWINKLANYTDWNIGNNAVSGSRLLDAASRLRSNAATFGITPSTFRPTYVTLQNNGNEYFPTTGENLDLYLEQFRIAVESVYALGAKPIIGTDHHVNGNLFLEANLKNFSDRHKIPYMGIGMLGEKIMSSAYQGSWGGSHPGMRINSFTWQEWLYFINQLPRPRKTIKIFRPRNTGLAIDALNYDSIGQRFERWIELNVGEQSLTVGDGSEDYYDRLNEGTTVDPADENNIITTYHLQNNSNEYALMMGGTSVSFIDWALFELIVDKVRLASCEIKVKGDAGLTFYLKNNNDSTKYESVDRDKALVFQVTKAVFDAFTDVVGTKFTSAGVKAGNVQFAYTGKLKSQAMGKGWFLCFLADADVLIGDRVSATTVITRVSDSGTIATVNQKTGYRYGLTYFTKMFAPKGGWKTLTTEVVYASGEYTITLPADSAQYFEFDKLKLIASKTGAFLISNVQAAYSGGTGKPEFTKQIEQKPFGSELIATRGFDANWTTTGGWTANGNTLVSMPAGVRDYPPYLSTTNHIELGFDPNGFSQKSSKVITLPGSAVTDRRGFQKVIVRVVARLFPQIYNPTQTGPYYSATPVITKTSYDLATLCVGFRNAASSNPEVVMRQPVDIGWSEVVFETTLPIMSNSFTLDLWRDVEGSNPNPSIPMQVYDVSVQII